MIVPLRDEFLLISGTRSFLLAVKANALFALRIVTADKEYSQTIEPTDLIVVSAPEGGALEPAIMLAEFVRIYRMPLIVLPKEHPGSKRFSYLVSVGPRITTSCTIRRGTHPEQHLVCSSDELAGTTIKVHPEGVEVTGLPATATHRYVKYQMLTDLS
ncbi:MAG: alpha/beta hydrolase [Methanoregula sp.]|jgi:hypothetical protein|uniref:alpha/beta hydrolase n=1 Tax=Methanoregula sp. TaxID=2052170 RepID=UPI0025D208CC|nr:alpha/beta hydrolase [Methanoregula sp.]MCK9632293.1 alpha/beta hydrolase [Methanoregula sp.]